MPDAAHPHAGVHVERRHLGWNRDLPPAAVAAPGTTLTLVCEDASGGQVTA